MKIILEEPKNQKANLLLEDKLTETDISCLLIWKYMIENMDRKKVSSVYGKKA